MAQPVAAVHAAADPSQAPIVMVGGKRKHHVTADNDAVVGAGDDGLPPGAKRLPRAAVACATSVAGAAAAAATARVEVLAADGLGPDPDADVLDATQSRAIRVLTELTFTAAPPPHGVPAAADAMALHPLQLSPSAATALVCRAVAFDRWARTRRLRPSKDDADATGGDHPQHHHHQHHHHHAAAPVLPPGRWLELPCTTPATFHDPGGGGVVGDVAVAMRFAAHVRALNLRLARAAATGTHAQVRPAAAAAANAHSVTGSEVDTAAGAARAADEPVCDLHLAAALFEALYGSTAARGDDDDDNIDSNDEHDALDWALRAILCASCGGRALRLDATYDVRFLDRDEADSDFEDRYRRRWGPTRIGVLHAACRHSPRLALALLNLPPAYGLDVNRTGYCGETALQTAFDRLITEPGRDALVQRLMRRVNDAALNTRVAADSDDDGDDDGHDDGDDHDNDHDDDDSASVRVGGEGGCDGGAASSARVVAVASRSARLAERGVPLLHWMLRVLSGHGATGRAVLLAHINTLCGPDVARNDGSGYNLFVRYRDPTEPLGPTTAAAMADRLARSAEHDLRKLQQSRANMRFYMAADHEALMAARDASDVEPRTRDLQRTRAIVDAGVARVTAYARDFRVTCRALMCGATPLSESAVPVAVMDVIVSYALHALSR